MIKVAIMGCGTIGSGVYEVIEGNQEILQKELGEEIRVAKILDLRQFPGAPYEKIVTGDFSEIEKDPEISIVVETMGGTKPAYDFVKACLLAGKHVVTSNKALVAAHGTELLQIARDKKINFFFEAAVGGGIPVIRTLGTGYAGQEITEITGILNGTTNYILTEMDRNGTSFDDALKEAQRLGYAERNPEADVEGFDTCRKIAILTSLVTDSAVNFEKVYTEGITKIDALDFAYAKMLNASIRLVGSAVRENGRVAVSVCPKLIPEDNPLCGVHGVFNGILVRGNMLGVTMLYGSGAGKLPTASAVLADIVEAAKNRDRNVPFGWHAGETEPEPMGDSVHRYLVRLGADEAEQASKLFGGAETLRPEGAAANREAAVFTGSMKERDMQEALKQLNTVIKVIRA